MSKNNYKGCEEFGHDFSRTKTVSIDAWGTKKKRIRYCSFCGQEKETAAHKEVDAPT